jgi:hypothetical protein
MPDLTKAARLTFADQLRFARHTALGDAEGFDEIVHAVERLGSYLTKERIGDVGDQGNLNKYQCALSELASSSGLASDVPSSFRGLLTPFNQVYDLVRLARNDAMHQGAFARHLTVHAVELAIILEDALTQFESPMISDFMVRSPLCAELWQPVGFVRQQLLANSYSYLPVRKDQKWYLISDVAIAIYLGPVRDGKGRRKRLASTLADAFRPWDLRPVELKPESTLLEDALTALTRESVLLVHHSHDEHALAGLVTAFDLL